MADYSEMIKEIENNIESALWEAEVHEELEKALKIYQQAEMQLLSLDIQGDQPAYIDQQRVLSYCLMRQGNILRQLGKSQDALKLGKREIAAARLSGDEITLARSLMSNGTNLLIAGEVEQGLQLLEQSRQLFEKSDSYDYKQGLGWYWILHADLANAGLVKKDPAEVVEIASRALEILEPIENWPGVARCYDARAVARQKLGDLEGVEKDRLEQKAAEEKIDTKN